MHLTVRKYRKIEGDRKELEALVSREFVPMMTKIDGFVDYYALFADDNTLMSVTVFKDAKGAEESVRVAAKWVSEKLTKMLPEKPEVTSGEVFAHRQLEQRKAA